MKNPFEIYTSFNSDLKSGRTCGLGGIGMDMEGSVEELHVLIARRQTTASVVVFVFFVCNFWSENFLFTVIKGESFRVLSENNRVKKPESLLTPGA